LKHRLAALLLLNVCLAGAPTGAATSASTGPPRSVAECDVAVAEHPRSHEAWFCYRQLADSWGRGFEPLVGHLEKRLTQHPGDHMNELYLGLISLNADRPDEAERLLRAAADGFGAEHDVPGEMKASGLLVSMLCRGRRFADAGPRLQRLERLTEGSSEPDLRAEARLRAQSCYFYRSDYGRAAAVLVRAREDIQQLAASPRAELLQRLTLDALAATYSNMGRHRDAYEVMQHALALARTDPARAETRHRLAYEAFHLADDGELGWDEVDRLIQDSLDMERVIGRPYVQAYESRILFALRAGPTPAGLTALEQAVAYGRKEYPHTAVIALRLLAKMRFDLDPDRSEGPLALLDESLSLSHEHKLELEEANGRLMQSYIRFKVGLRAQALADAEAALGEFDRVRDLQPEAMVRAFTSAETTYGHELVAGYLVDPAHGPSSAADVERSFQILEGRRARVLLAALMAARALPPPPGSLRDRRDALTTERASIQKVLVRPTLGAGERERALAELAKVELAEEVLRDDLARQTAEGQALQALPPTVASVQQALATDEALLSFQTWRRQHSEDAPFQDGSSWVLVITRDAVRPARIPDDNELRRRVEFLDSLIELRDGSELDGAVALHKELLAGALATLPATVTRLVIVPDGPLHSLPFGALRASRGAPPLASRYALSVAPSAALWLRWRTGPRSPPEGSMALVLADPTREEATQAQTVDVPVSREAAVWVNGLNLPALPFARQEAASISRVLGSSRVLVGPDATERFLKTTDLRPYRALHLAAHAVVDPARPERSAVVLAPGAPEEDGLLQLHEVVDLDLAGKLVVLSACRSSSGAILPGEGPLSLARAFFQAGARTVVGSLWAVRDQDASRVMDGFYRALADGETAAGALAQAQRERIFAGDATAAWAGVLVLGDGSLALREPGPSRQGVPVSRWGGMTVLLLLLALALGWGLARRGAIRGRAASKERSATRSPGSIS
jgi:CHAT domain-containing protein